MPGGIAITNPDHTIADSRAPAHRCKNRKVARRLRAIIGVMADRKSRGEIALRARVDRQTLRERVTRYNAEGPDGRKDRQQCGRPAKPDEGQRAEVGRWLAEGPTLTTPPGPSGWSGRGSGRSSVSCRAWKRSGAWCHVAFDICCVGSGK